MSLSQHPVGRCAAIGFRRYLLIGTVSTTGWLAASMPARAEFVLYDNLSTDTTYSAGAVWLVSGSAMSPPSITRFESFVPIETGTLGRILVSVRKSTSPGGTPSPEFGLILKDAADNILESWTGLIAPDPFVVGISSVPLVAVDSLLSPLLEIGKTYSLTAIAANELTNVGWNFSTSSLIPNKSGFRVLAEGDTGSPNPVPEPSSLTLLCLALFCGGGVARFKHNHKILAHRTMTA